MIYTIITLNLFVFAITHGTDSSMWQLHYMGAWHQYLTYMFLHASPLHLLINSAALLSLGKRVEKELPPKRFLMLYLLAGIGGAIAHQLFMSCTPAAQALPTVGASAALMGVFIAAFRSHRHAAAIISITIAIEVCGILNAGFLFAHCAHLGGMFTAAIFLKAAR